MKLGGSKGYCSATVLEGEALRTAGVEDMRIKMPISGLATILSMLLAISIPASAQDPKRGGTLTMVLGSEPTAMSTIASTALAVAVVHAKIFDSLLEYTGPELTAQPGIAKSWTVSDDKRTYAFKLRPNVVFHDGQPMTSADVKFSIEKIVIPYHSRGRGNFQQLEAIETPDPQTVVFRLKGPQPYFLKVFQAGETPIMPKHLIDTPQYADLGKFRTSEFMLKPIGTGPFRVVEYVKGSHILLDRHPQYWREGQPYLDRLIMKIIPDDTARVIAMEKGEADVAVYGTLPETDIERLTSLPHIKSSNDGMEAIGPVANLTLNLRDKYMGDLKVRQAMSLALDRKAIANVIFYGLAKPATSPIFPGNPMFNAKLPPYPYDLRKANALLDEGGYKRGANGMRFSITLDYIPYGAVWQRLAEYTKAQLRQIGIDGNIRSTDMGSWLKLVYTDWDFQATSVFGNSYADPAIGTARYYISSNIKKGAAFTNVAGYANPRVDELFAKAAVETDEAKRKAMYDEAQAIMYEELPVLQLIAMPTTTVWNKRVHNLITNGISPYTGYADVWVD